MQVRFRALSLIRQNTSITLKLPSRIWKTTITFSVKPINVKENLKCGIHQTLINTSILTYQVLMLATESARYWWTYVTYISQNFIYL